MELQAQQIPSIIIMGAKFDNFLANMGIESQWN
jgi:hypothetical protein